MATTKPLKIAYCTWQDPSDKGVLSGVHYYALNALRKHCGEVVCLGPLPSGYMRIGRLYNKLALRFLNHRYDYLHSRIVSRNFAARIESKLQEIECDVLFAPIVSETIAYLNTKIPIIYLADTTFALMEDYYPAFTNLLDQSRRQSHEIERRAIQNASRIIYASNWAAESGRRQYDCPEEKIRIELLGCNLDQPPSREEVLKKEMGKTCKLLFISREWNRKGGDIVFGAFRALNDQGIDTRLTVIGCSPPAPLRDEKMQVISYLDKNDPDDSERYYRFIKESTFLFSPTRRDCSPMIFSEAAAYGLPVISTDVGGVASIVQDGVNGFLLSKEDGPREYAGLISRAIADKGEYLKMVAASRDLFERTLNWDRWGRNVRQILEEVVASNGT